MTRPHARRRLLALALATALSGAALAQEFEAFTVTDIRVDGLQRISAGTVFTYLPVERGDVLDRATSAEAIRALYRTGFFSDVKLERQGGILVVTVTERPAINKLSISGNKDIKTEELLKGLKGIGLAEGETFNPLNLDRITQELTRQYNNRGKYNVTISPTVAELDRNRVDVSIAISEGKASRIRDINLVGNATFPEAEIRKDWESNTSNWLSWYRRDDQYSREKLSGDLEKLGNFYLDRGYIDFNIESTQVAISPDKKDMYITANISEGEVYTVTGVQISGDTILPKEEFEKLLLLKEGDTFSRRKVELTSDAITAVLGNIGFAFARVNPLPDIDRENRKLSINFYVEPGPRVQVRRIVFKGNSKTADEVLRREMRQFENAWYSQAALDRSKVRLRRLGFFEEVDIETPEVSGQPDQVDVVVNVKERNSGQFTFGLGYSQLAGLITSVQLDQMNFLGTGNRVGVGVQNNAYSKSFNFNFVDPYFTDDGVSLGYNLRYSDYDLGDFNTARYTNSNAAGELTFGIPLTETDSIQLALGIDRNGITTTDGSTPPMLVDYLVDTLGERARFPVFLLDDDDDPDTPDLEIEGDNRKWIINAWRAQLAWGRDSRNDFLLPTRGTYHRVHGEFVLPGSDLEYYRFSYNFEHYRPLNRWLVLKIGAELGYGDSYGKTRDKLCYDRDDDGLIIPATGEACGLPFFRNFFAGGPQSVRGFEANTLGPYYQFGEQSYRQPLGGAVKTAGTFELLFPTLFDGRGTRLSAFVDYGNVFASPGDFDANELRVSTGLALQWQSPMGPIGISWAFPIRKKDTDRIERLQFSFGGQF